MAPPSLTCPVCGYEYDPSGRNACGSCPLNSGCQMVCCPHCGHTTIDPSQSSLVRLVTKFLAAGKRVAPGAVDKVPQNTAANHTPAGTPPELVEEPRPVCSPDVPLTRLDRVLPGTCARVEKLDRRLAPDRQVRLRAYGLVPGFRIEVIQQTPVTIVRIDHLELALEKTLAAGVWVRCDFGTDP